jgi:hypothetical protein
MASTRPFDDRDVGVSATRISRHIKAPARPSIERFSIA